MPESACEADEGSPSPSSAHRRTSTTHTDHQRYLSTRGQDIGLRFIDTVLNPLASDGGLYLPEEVPRLEPAALAAWSNLTFRDLALAIFGLFVSPTEIPAEHLADIVDAALAGFAHPEAIAVLVEIDEQRGLYLLELYNGPGGVGEDLGLHMLAAFLDYLVGRENNEHENKECSRTVILDGIGGVVGRAARRAFEGRHNLLFCSLEPAAAGTPRHPLQLSTESPTASHQITDISVQGTADDCKRISRELARQDSTGRVQDLETLLGGSWVRTLAEVVVHHHAYLAIARSRPGFRLGADQVAVAAATDDWDVVGALVARRMGLPLAHAAVATSRADDALARLWATSRYDGGGGAAEPPEFLAGPHAERLLWFMAYDFVAVAGRGIMDDLWARRQAGGEVAAWLAHLRRRDAFGPVYHDVAHGARRFFRCEPVPPRPHAARAVAEVRARCAGRVVHPTAAAALLAASRPSSTPRPVSVALAPRGPAPALEDDVAAAAAAACVVPNEAGAVREALEAILQAAR